MALLPATGVLAAAIVSACLGLAGCAALALPRLSVVAYSPVEERPDLQGVEVWVEFSGPVDQTRAEEAFSLAEDRTRLEGRFSWEGDRLCFRPLRPVHAGHHYLVVVTTSVESPSGVSLDRELRFAFSTRAEEERPAITGCTPVDGATIDDLLSPVTICFSEPVDQASFLGAFTVSPPIAGGFTWSSDGTACTLSPVQQLEWQAEYTVRMAASLADLAGNLLGEEKTWRFSVGTDVTPATVVEVRNTVDGAAGTVALGEGTTHGWEADWGLRITFSEPVLREDLEGCLAVEPAWDFEIEGTGRSSDTFLLAPRGRLARDTRCTLTVRRGLADLHGNATVADVAFRFVADGPATAPPSVARLAFRSNPSRPPAEAAFLEYAPTDVDAGFPLDPAEFPVATVTATTLDLYLTLAPGAAPSLFSLMESLAVSVTGSCVAISITGIRLSGFEDPQPPAVAGCVPARAYLSVANTSDSGIVRFQLRAGLKDSRGNELEAGWELPLLK